MTPVEIAGRCIAFTCTPLMCVAVAAILPPGHQALLRSAGSAGVAAYNEVVAQSGASMYIETDTGISGLYDYVPCTLPLSSNSGTLVMHTRGRGRNFGVAPLGSPIRVRYEGSPEDLEIGGTALMR